MKGFPGVTVKAFPGIIRSSSNDTNVGNNIRLDRYSLKLIYCIHSESEKKRTYFSNVAMRFSHDLFLPPDMIATNLSVVGSGPIRSPGNSLPMRFSMNVVLGTRIIMKSIQSIVDNVLCK